MRPMLSRNLLLGSLFTLAACVSGTPTGEIRVTAYGEDFIESGIPASETDGWEVTFETFDVVFKDILVADQHVAITYGIDLTKPSEGEGQLLGVAEVAPGDYTAPSFSLRRVEVVGQATKGDVTKTFSWVFPQEVHYSECETTTQVTAGETTGFQITVHADHLFYDSLVSSDPALVFQGLADADVDGDGAITQEELEAADLGAYDPGSDGTIENLWDYLVAQSATLGHVDGEGHCDAAFVEE